MVVFENCALLLGDSPVVRDCIDLKKKKKKEVDTQCYPDSVNIRQTTTMTGTDIYSGNYFILCI